MKSLLKKYLPFTIFITIILLYLYRCVYLNNSYFIKNEIHSKIIKVTNFENKSLLFYYNDQYAISTGDTNRDTLKIGDSISKKSNSKKFNVYRKIGKNYVLFNTYEKKSY